MPKKKTTRAKKTDTMMEDTSMVMESKPMTGKLPQRSKRFWIIAVLVLAGAAILGLLTRNKGWILAANVNGAPISRMELNGRLTDRFGTQMLEAIIGETLILQEAQKQNVSVSPDEMSEKIGTIEQSLGGADSLEQSLKLQGITRGEFEKQIRIQLLIDKMLGDEVSVSAEEVDDFVKTNAALLTATTEAEQKTEAETQIRNNKVSQKFVEWFAQLKENAKIEKFL